MTNRAALDDEELITLAKACELYPDSGLTVHTLRARAADGRLTTYKVGKHVCTTPADMREMVQACRVEKARPGSISTEDNGASETERIASARAALNQSVTALKSNLPHISPRSTRRAAARTR